MPTSADTQTWQRLAQEAQAAWLNGESDHAGELFMQLYNESIGWLLQIAKAKAPTDIAEEAVAETLFQFYQLLSEGRQIHKTKSLLRTILRRRIVDMLRQRHEIHVQMFDDTTWANVIERPDVEEIPEEVVIARDAANVILDALPDEERLVLIARHMRDLTVKQTVHLLHLTEDQVKKRLQHAMMRARQIAEERGLL